MADRSDLLSAKLGNPSSSSTSFRALGVREEGEVSSGGEDESVLGRAPNLEPSNLSLTSNAEKSTKIGAITTSSLPNPNPVPVPSSNPNLQWVMPQTTPHSYRNKSYNKKMPYNKLATNRNLSWQKKRPLDDHNLVISFSDDDSESDTTPANVQVQVRPQMTRSGPTNSTAARNSILGPSGSALRPNTTLQTKASPSQSNGALGSSSDKVLETLRLEIALREKSLKIQKAGSIEATYGRPSKRMKVEPPSNGNQSTKEDQLNFNASPSGYMKGDSNQFVNQQNGNENNGVSAPGSGIVLSKSDNGGGEINGRLILSGMHRSADVSAWLNTNAENTDSQTQLQCLMEQEDAQDRDLEQAQELRRRLEREEREAFKAYRKAQRALFEANEKCNLLQKKRDILSNRVNSLVENSSNSNTPWPLCWHDPRESPSDQPADGTRVAGSRNDTREEGQLTDSTNTKDQLEEGATLSDVDKRGSPSGDSSPQDYEALEASLRSALVARYRNKAPLNSTKSAERDAIDEPATEIQENLSLSPNETQVSPKDLIESTEERMVNQENLSPRDVIDQRSTQTQENISFSLNETQVSPKDFIESTEERMVNQENLFPRDVIDQRSTQTQENISFSPNETQGSPSGPTPIAHSVSISPSVGGNNFPSKKNTESTEEKLVNQESLFPRDVIDQSSTQTQENNSFSPNETQGSPSGPTPVAHFVSISPSVGGDDLPSKNFTESTEEKLVNQENVPFGEPQENITQSPNASCELLLPVKETGENITCTSLKTISELVVSHFVLPPSTIRNACVHFKQMVNSSDDAHNARYEGMNIVNKSERTREDTGVWGPQLDPFWPFCIFELRGRCNDEECRWQHVKDYEWRKFRPDNSLNSPSGLYQHMVHVPTHRIGSCIIKDGPYMACSVQAQGLWQHWQRGFCALFPVPVSVKRLLRTDAPCLSFPEASVAHQYNEKLLLEEDLPEAEKCLELALNSSLGKQKVLSVLSRALERDPKSVLIWIVYLHIYYMKEKDLGKDDMFLDAVHNNKYSYDLWLMYINSRLKLEDQLSAFTDALTNMCQLGPTTDKEKKDLSSVILDLYLHMVNTLCMSGNTEMAISRVFKSSSDELLTAILSSLIVPDKCIFWVSSIYLSTYGRLPEGLLEQLQLDKDLYSVIDWPSVSLTTNDAFRVLRLFNFAIINTGLTELCLNTPKTDGEYLKELHFLALSHLKCKAAIRGGPNGATDLLVKYKEMFPNCVELALISARLGENGFEVAISDWPRQFEGFQCIWNQYAQHLLASERFDVTRHLLSRWYGDAKLESFIDTNSESNDSIPRKEQLFGLLNLSLYQLMQDDLPAAHCSVDKALKLTDKELYMHCLKEHVIVYLLKESLVNQTDISSQVVLDLIRVYLKDARTRPARKILSRKFYQDIKETRTRQLLDEWLGPVSDDYSLINSILEMCHGELLIPENSGIKELVNLVESVTQISPANYRFALSVCRFVIKRFGFDDIGTMSVRFWTGSALVNSIFQSVPVAPEPVWVEGAEVLVNLNLFEISNRFLEHAVSVYPFSLRLWQSYLYLSKRMNESGDRIIEAAKKRGIELSP